MSGSRDLVTGGECRDTRVGWANTGGYRRLGLALVILACVPAGPATGGGEGSSGETPLQPTSASPAAKIRFELDRLGPDGLQGPPDGLRALHYEYCIPDRPDAVRAVVAIDPTLQIQRGSPGRVGCGARELLCLGHTHQPDHRAVLQRLASLPWVAEIREAFFE